MEKGDSPKREQLSQIFGEFCVWGAVEAGVFKAVVNITTGNCRCVPTWVWRQIRLSPLRLAQSIPLKVGEA